MVNEINVSVSADKAWHVLGEQFGDIARWLTSLLSSHLQGELGPGAIRVCETAGIGPFPPGKVTEEIIHFDSSQYEFTYAGREGMPWFIDSAQNAWSIKAVDKSNCVITSVATIKVKWFMMPIGWVLPIVLKREFGHVFEELGYAIEFGKAHPRVTKAKVV